MSTVQSKTANRASDGHRTNAEALRCQNSTSKDGRTTLSKSSNHRSAKESYILGWKFFLCALASKVRSEDISGVACARGRCTLLNKANTKIILFSECVCVCEDEQKS